MTNSDSYSWLKLLVLLINCSHFIRYEANVYNDAVTRDYIRVQNENAADSSLDLDRVTYITTHKDFQDTVFWLTFSEVISTFILRDRWSLCIFALDCC